MELKEKKFLSAETLFFKVALLYSLYSCIPLVLLILFIKIEIFGVSWQIKLLLWYLVILPLLTFILTYFSAKKRYNYFFVSVNASDVSYQQAFMASDSLIFRMPFFSRLVLIYYMMSFKLEEVRSGQLLFSEIGAVIIRRGLLDRLFGIASLIVLPKGQKWSMFSPPQVNYLLPGDSRKYNLIQRATLFDQWFITIPGLKRQDAMRLQASIIDAIPDINTEDTLPRSFNKLSFIGTPLLAILTVVFLVWFLFKLTGGY